MMFSSSSFEYYDPEESWIEFRTFLEVAESNFEFESWLIDNEYYLVEAVVDPSQAHQQWKNNTITKVKTTLQQFAQFSLQQIAKDQRTLQINREICMNMKRFPPKQNISMKSAPNYAAAMNRLSMPIGTHLASIDFSKIDTNGKNPKVNMQIKKAILPPYDGNSDFKQFAKNYFYGADGNRIDLSNQQCAQIIPLAYQYCTTYESKLNTLETEINTLINFINTDPTDGNTKPVNKQQLQMAQQQKAIPNTQASSNPAANAAGMARPVNADTNYEYFMKYYFDEDVNQQQTILGRKPVNPVQTVPKTDTPGETQPNSKSLMYKRKQVASDIAIDAFNAKISAFGMIYHDFIYLLRAHIAAYKGAVAGNEGRVQLQQPMKQ